MCSASTRSQSSVSGESNRGTILPNVETIQSDCATGLSDDSVDVAPLYDVFHKLSDPERALGVASSTYARRDSVV